MCFWFKSEIPAQLTYLNKVGIHPWFFNKILCISTCTLFVFYICIKIREGEFNSKFRIHHVVICRHFHTLPAPFSYDKHKHNPDFLFEFSEYITFHPQSSKCENFTCCKLHEWRAKTRRHKLEKFLDGIHYTEKSLTKK